MLAGSIITKYYFDISMENVQSVQLSQPLHDLHKDTPNFLFTNVSALFLMFDDLVTEVTLASVLHNDA